MAQYSKKYLVSIITATYNRVDLLPRSIKSVLAQTYTNIELIIVDGASTDGTNKAVRSIKDKRVRYFRQRKNYGLLSAKNKGISLAKGTYLCFLDDDDELLPEAIEASVKTFERIKQADILWWDSEDSRLGNTMGFGIGYEGFVDYRDYLCEKISGEYWQIIRKSIIEKHRFDENLWGAEGNLWLKLMKDWKLYYTPKTLRIYHRDHGGNVCKFENQLKKADKFVLNNLAFLKEFGEEQKRLCPKAYARRLSVLGFWQIMAGDTKEGRNTLKKSLKINIAPKPLVLYLSSAFIGKEKLARIYSKIASSKLLGKISS
jgi:GalNAc5-diNAcBac-PP-undecaprenol beta-1,3-glucosyltransferase